MKKVLVTLVLCLGSAAFAETAGAPVSDFNSQLQACVAQTDAQPACFEDINNAALDLGVAPEAIAMCNQSEVAADYSNCMMKTAAVCIGRLCIGRPHHRWHHRHGRRWHRRY